jgi:hypothetical protein
MPYPYNGEARIGVSRIELRKRPAKNGEAFSQAFSI